jgi:hypothetical protein
MHFFSQFRPRHLIVLVFCGGVTFLAVTREDIPREYAALTSTVIGGYFGQLVPSRQQNREEEDV